MEIASPSQALPTSPGYRCGEITPEHVRSLQAFFEANPEYHRSVEGRAPAPDAAEREFQSLPPPDWPKGRRRVLAFDDVGGMAAMADVTSDLLAERVWHLGLFIVATRLHGSGAAHELCGALEAWMRQNGARWIRLGVVAGNGRAERFWERRGYREARRRCGIAMGECVNDIRVLVKPLAGATMEEYLRLVARDRPESP